MFFLLVFSEQFRWWRERVCEASERTTTHLVPWMRKLSVKQIMIRCT